LDSFHFHTGQFVAKATGNAACYMLATMLTVI